MNQKIPKLTSRKYCMHCAYFTDGFNYCKHFRVEVRPKLSACSHFESKDNQHYHIDE